MKSAKSMSKKNWAKITLCVLVACAILDMERDTLMLSGFGSNEILKVRPWLPPSPLPWRHISRV